MTSRIMRALLPKSPASPLSGFNRGLSSVEPGSRSDQIKARSRHQARPSRTLPMTNGQVLQTCRNPHNQHLPKTIHNITRTTLRFKTRRPVEGSISRGKNHHGETSDVSIPTPSLAPFFSFFVFLSLTPALALKGWANNGTPRSQTTTGGVTLPETTALPFQHDGRWVQRSRGSVKVDKDGRTCWHPKGR